MQKDSPLVKNGLIMREKYAFDFVVRPEVKVAMQTNKKRDPDSGRAKLEKTLLNLKRTNAKILH